MRFPILAALSLWAGSSAAEVPVVATDIAPVHSLVAQVMDGVGTPLLVIRPGVSPHDYALRPSEAKALQSAHLVVWVGESLTPWMEKPISALAADAVQLELLELDGTILHEFHDGHEGEDAHGHDHEGLDPHAWLDPRNARNWLGHIASALAEADPENAGAYQSNAAAAKDRLVQLEADLVARLAPMQDRPFVTYHDAYRYFEHRFSLKSAGSITFGDAGSPGPAHLAEMRELVRSENVTCIFSEPQFDTRLVDAVADGGGVQVYLLDPLGAEFEPNAGLYDAVLNRMADGFAACADGK